MKASQSKLGKLFGSRATGSNDNADAAISVHGGSELRASPTIDSPPTSSIVRRLSLRKSPKSVNKVPSKIAMSESTDTLPKQTARRNSTSTGAYTHSTQSDRTNSSNRGRRSPPNIFSVGVAGALATPKKPKPLAIIIPKDKSKKGKRKGKEIPHVYPLGVDQARFPMLAKARCDAEYSDDRWISFKQDQVLYTDGITKILNTPNKEDVLMICDASGKIGYGYVSDLYIVSKVKPVEFLPGAMVPISMAERMANIAARSQPAIDHSGAASATASPRSASPGIQQPLKPPIVQVSKDTATSPTLPHPRVVWIIPPPKTRKLMPTIIKSRSESESDFELEDLSRRHHTSDYVRRPTVSDDDDEIEYVRRDTLDDEIQVVAREPVTLFSGDDSSRGSSPEQDVAQRRAGKLARVLGEDVLDDSMMPLQALKGLRNNMVTDLNTTSSSTYRHRRRTRTASGAALDTIEESLADHRLPLRAGGYHSEAGSAFLKNRRGYTSIVGVASDTESLPTPVFLRPYSARRKGRGIVGPSPWHSDIELSEPESLITPVFWKPPSSVVAAAPAAISAFSSPSDVGEDDDVAQIERDPTEAIQETENVSSSSPRPEELRLMGSSPNHSPSAGLALFPSTALNSTSPVPRVHKRSASGSSTPSPPHLPQVDGSPVSSTVLNTSSDEERTLNEDQQLKSSNGSAPDWTSLRRGISALSLES